MSPKPHLVAVPDSESRSRRPIAPPTQGALALRYQAVPEVPGPPDLRLVPGTADALPDAQAWSARLVQAVGEVLAGDRPIAQLVRWTDPVVYAELNRRVRLLGLTTTASARVAEGRCSVRSVRVSVPAEGVAEVAAHIRHGERSRAMALRLEVRRRRWVCTAIEVG